LKRSIFEVLHFRVFSHRNFNGINIKNLKPYCQILSRNLSKLE